MDTERFRERIAEERGNRRKARERAAELSIEATARAQQAEQEALSRQREQEKQDREQRLHTTGQVAKVRKLVSVILPELDIRKSILFESQDRTRLRLRAASDFRAWIVQEPDTPEQYITGSYYYPDGPPVPSPFRSAVPTYSTYHVNGVLLTTDGTLRAYSTGKKGPVGTNFLYRADSGWGSSEETISVNPQSMDDAAIYSRAEQWTPAQPTDMSDLQSEAWADRLLRLPLKD